MAERDGSGPSAFLPRALHTVSVADLRIVDLDGAALEVLGLSLDDVTDLDDLSIPQAIGEAARFLGFQGIRAPSATGLGHAIVAFESRLEADQLTLVQTEIL
jgi:hypothetical protein